MGQQKLNVIALGPSGGNSAVATSRLVASGSACSFWLVGTTYNKHDIVEYSGSLYRSLIDTNSGNQPDLTVPPLVPSPSWQIELKGVQDGDACVVVSGANSTIQQRVGGIWTSITGQPVKVPLLDNTSGTVFSFHAANLPYAEIEYTILRGVGYQPKKKGTITVLNAGVGQLQFSHEFIEIGGDVDVLLSMEVVAGGGGTFNLNYVAGLAGQNIEFAYTLKGWQ